MSTEEKFITVEAFRVWATTDWLEAAKSWHRWQDGWDDYAAGEWKRIRECEAVLKETTPEKYRTGIHLLFPQEAHCGEDVYVIDGGLCQTLHARHIPCDTPSLLNPKGTIYCGKCGTVAPKSEILGL